MVATPNLTLISANLIKANFKQPKSSDGLKNSPHPNAVSRPFTERHVCEVWSLRSFFWCETFWVESFWVLPITVIVVQTNDWNHDLKLFVDRVFRSRNLIIFQTFSNNRKSWREHSQCFCNQRTLESLSQNKIKSLTVHDLVQIRHFVDVIVSQLSFFGRRHLVDFFAQSFLDFGV